MMIQNSIELRCPETLEPLTRVGKDMLRSASGLTYPIVKGVPILISSKNKMFDASHVTSPTNSGFSSSRIRALSRFFPQPTLNVGGRRMMRGLADCAKPTQSKCLIIGSGESVGFNQFVAGLFDETVISDVVLSPGVSVVCDGHQLPFQDDTFDCIILVAVLEHVLDPNTVVASVARTLRKDGLVAADTPFMQQVHMGAHDFTRFTDLGYRWLFREFEELDRGISVGPGSALLWSISYFFTSFANSYRAALILKGMARLLFFWIKYFDYVLVDRKGAHDAAGGFYFLGRNKKSQQIDEAALLAEYRGLNRGG